MKLSLSDKILSSQDLTALIMEIRRYASWFAQHSIKNQVTGLGSKESLAISETAASLIKELAASQPLNQKALDELLDSLKKLQAQTPSITITLAAMPGMALKRSLVEWCRKNITADILVDFKFNATILGGMVVQHGSHIYDWSFKRQIMAARSKFPEVLRNV